MTEPWLVHTVVFDLDDTLYPERDFVLSGFAAAGAWLERERGIRGFSDLAGKLFAAGSRGRIFDEALAHTGLPDVSDIVPKLVRAYRDHTPAISLSDEAIHMLDWAKANFRLAVLSDGYLEVQQRKAAALGLSRWTNCLVFSDSWGRESWKPSERPFREVMQALPGESRGYVYVSDNPRKDFIAPRRLGWRTVRFRRPGGEHENYSGSPTESADCDIDSLLELKRIVTTLH